MSTVVSFTPLPVAADSRTFKEASSFARFGHRSVVIEGADKETVGQVAAEIRLLRPPEPYKGTGIKYKGEVIRRKAGKKAAATAS